VRPVGTRLAAFRFRQAGSTGLPSRRPPRAAAGRSRHHSSIQEFGMKKTLCAMKAALGVRGVIGCSLWRWLQYHNI